MATKKPAQRKGNAQPEVERQLEEYFSVPYFERPNDEADLRLTEFVGHLLDQSPARQQLAVDVYRACARAWDAGRETWSIIGKQERAILHTYHALTVALINALEPLPIDQSIRRELEIYGAGADLETRAAINKVLKGNNERAVQALWAHVSTYGTIKKERKRA
jgi:hypothetical protein